MPDRPKRVAAIHDLSGFGRCSLSVILPTLSVMGVQVCPVPTTVFSTHTGGLGSVEQRDLSDFTLPCLEHYRRLGLEFECVYSGFLSSQEQIDHCLKFFSTYQDALAVVDPVMGDHGRPYRTITPQMRRNPKPIFRRIFQGFVGSFLSYNLPFLWKTCYTVHNLCISAIGGVCHARSS